MNLVILPMENVDGAAIHYELQKDNPLLETACGAVQCDRKRVLL